MTFDGIPNIPPNPYGIPLFNNPTDPTNPANGISVQGLQLRHSLADFVFAFDTNMFPIVGQQITLTQDDAAAVAARIALFEAQATAGACDLVAHGTLFGQDHGFTFSNGTWVADVSWLPALTDAQLTALAGFAPLTFTAVPRPRVGRISLGTVRRARSGASTTLGRRGRAGRRLRARTKLRRGTPALLVLGLTALRGLQDLRLAA